MSYHPDSSFTPHATIPVLTQDEDPLSPARSSAVNGSVVDGIGQWNFWRRNFTSPLMAFYDLFDNCFDAMDLRNNSHCKGRITVTIDKGMTDGTTGLVITNNSYETIQPMSNILRVYNSGKDGNDTTTSKKQQSGQSQIGQNGIGLKQGCAALSDCSFAMSKTNTNTYELGILAESLQTKQQCLLPVLSNLQGTSGDRKAKIKEWARSNQNIAHCIAEYGDGLMMDGIDRLDKHFANMTTGVWADHKHVFRLVLVGLRHKNKDNGEEDEREVENPQADRALHFLLELKQNLPQRYIHVPSHVDVEISGVKIEFSYWQSRLAGITEFNLTIGKTKSYARDDHWKKASPGTDGYYNLPVFIGFDFKRIMDENAKERSLKMFIYSRESGRLIRTYTDARSILRLTSSSSGYSQGLTIIVDDRGGFLPLTPTKQDIAFAEETSCEEHEQNFFDWLNVATRRYYNYFWHGRYSGSKDYVTKAVTWVAGRANAQGAPVSFPPLSECQIDRFCGTLVSTVSNLGKLKLSSTKNMEVIPGRDSQMFRMPTLDELLAEYPEAAQTANKKRKFEAIQQNLVDDKDHQIAEYRRRIDDLETERNQQSAPRNGIRQTKLMEARIAKLESDLKETKFQVKEKDNLLKVLTVDKNYLERENKRLRQAIREKDEAMEQYRRIRLQSTGHSEGEDDEGEVNSTASPSEVCSADV